MEPVTFNGNGFAPATIELSPVAIIPAFLTAKNAALADAKAITAITDVGSLNAVADALSRLKGLRKMMEAEHARIKAPVLEMGRNIDGLKKDFNASIEAEERRLSLILGAHQEKERRKAEDARRAAQAEAERIQREAQAAELERIARETKGRTGTLLPDVQQIREEAREAEAQVLASAASAASLAPSGTTVRRAWEFEVEDAGALYAARPELVTLTPNRAAIKAIVSKGVQLPGVRAWAQIIGGVKAAPVSIKQIADEYDY